MKSNTTYKTIGEVSRKLGLINKKTGQLQTHTIRYWEKQFRQIKPLVKAGKRRYYSDKDFKTIQQIKYLLKEKGLTINGVKKILNNNQIDSLDDNIDLGLYRSNLKTTKSIKNRLTKISKIIKDLKNIKNG